MHADEKVSLFSVWIKFLPCAARAVYVSKSAVTKGLMKGIDNNQIISPDITPSDNYPFLLLFKKKKKIEMSAVRKNCKKNISLAKSLARNFGKMTSTKLAKRRRKIK